MTTSSLPEPDAAARVHGLAVADFIRERLRAAGGWLSFADYMDAALYAPGLGYYSAGARKLGSGGDFSTAPELSPLFGGCIARVCRRVLTDIPDGSILELGAGTGVLAAELLNRLADRPPARYQILEVSADLKERQRRTLAERAPAFLSRVQWLDRLPEAPLRGLILANEVLDALPVERFRRGKDSIESLGVVTDGGEFREEGRAASGALRTAVTAIEAALGGPLAPGYQSEVNLRAPAFVTELASRFDAGLFLLVDYGGSVRDLYHPDRRSGTLTCHYRHRAHGDPFFWPGLQDITAWVDFSAVARAALAAGLEVEAYGTQAHFLLANGILDELAALPGAGPEAVIRAGAVKTLLMPGEMGEKFKVLALRRGNLPALGALLTRDLRPSL